MKGGSDGENCPILSQAVSHYSAAPDFTASATSRLPFRLIKDPIHGFMRLRKELFCVIDTPHFQRLRSLRQLGLLHYVFPSATHTRFEHSIGTANIAGTLLRTLQDLQGGTLRELSDRRCLLVQVAALVHDLGHGPFSHVFDGEVIPELIRRSGVSGAGGTPLPEPPAGGPGAPPPPLRGRGCTRT